MKTFITQTMLMLLAATSYAEVTDLLKPEYQKKEQAVQKLMDEFAEKGIVYDLKIVKAQYSKGPLKDNVDYTKYSVTLPSEIADKVHSLDWQVKSRMLFDFLDIEKHSFYAAVLMVENCGDKFVPDVDAVSLGSVESRIRKQDMFGGIMKQDKKLWDDQLLESLNFIVHPDEQNLNASERKVRRDMFLDSYFIAMPPRIQDACYKNSVLYESIPKIYYEDLFKTTNSIWVSCFRSRDKKWTLETWLKKLYMPTAETSAITFTRKHTDVLFRTPLLSEWENMRMLGTRRFIEICRENDPEKKPYISALMMALFTVDGYAFNDETGVYTMNERGKILMGYIVEFPIPENATRLQAVMNGGNKDEIEGMMKKHGTVEKWNGLLQNPVHPEFAKYPQDK